MSLYPSLTLHIQKWVSVFTVVLRTRQQWAGQSVSQSSSTPHDAMFVHLFCLHRSHVPPKYNKLSCSSGRSSQLVLFQLSSQVFRSWHVSGLCSVFLLLVPSQHDSQNAPHLIQELATIMYRITSVSLTLREDPVGGIELVNTDDYTFEIFLQFLPNTLLWSIQS